MDIITFRVIGVVAGWLAGKIVAGRGFGLGGNLIVGAIGALIGGFIFHVIGLHAYGIIAKGLMALIGAVVLLFLCAYVRRR